MEMEIPTYLTYTCTDVLHVAETWTIIDDHRKRTIAFPKIFSFLAADLERAHLVIISESKAERKYKITIIISSIHCIRQVTKTPLYFPSNYLPVRCVTLEAHHDGLLTIPEFPCPVGSKLDMFSKSRSFSELNLMSSQTQRERERESHGVIMTVAT